MKNNQIIINAMGKRIVIDNPIDIRIVFSDNGNIHNPLAFDLKINRKEIRELRNTFKKLNDDIGRGMML